MDIRLFVVVMAIAIIMDIIGRMARKRAGEQQVPPGEEWDMLNALTEQAEELRRRHREAPGPADVPTGGEAPPRAAGPVARQEQRIGGFEVWSELPPRTAPPEVPEPEPIVEPAVREPVFRERTPRAQAAEEPVFRDRTPRPLVIRSGERWPWDEEHGRPVPPSLPSQGPPAERARRASPDRPAAATRVAADHDRPLARAHSTVVTRPGAAPRIANLEYRFGLGTVGGLRSAIVAREVLGPPLALRGEEDKLGGR